MCSSRPFFKSNLPDSRKPLSDKLAWPEKNVYHLINKLHFWIVRKESIIVYSRTRVSCGYDASWNEKINTIARIKTD